MSMPTENKGRGTDFVKLLSSARATCTGSTYSLDVHILLRVEFIVAGSGVYDTHSHLAHALNAVRRVASSSELSRLWYAFMRLSRSSSGIGARYSSLIVEDEWDHSLEWEMRIARAMLQERDERFRLGKGTWVHWIQGWLVCVMSKNDTYTFFGGWRYHWAGRDQYSRLCLNKRNTNRSVRDLTRSGWD
jgi:hypothetical protein